jgi:hypothetical protein
MPKSKIVHWMCTLWCNYRCSYCRQPHERRQQWVNTKTPNDTRADVYSGMAAHWADNATVEEWARAFHRCFSRWDTSFAITGGEPMLDRCFDKLLHSMSWCRRIGVDTNLSWKPEVRKPPRNVFLKASWHPEHIDAAGFLDSVRRCLDYGWQVAVVNVVMMPDNFDKLHLVDQLARINVPVSVGHAYGQGVVYTEEQVATLRSLIPVEDWRWRSGERTTGLMCKYPSASYEVEPDGSALVSCHSQRWSVFTDDPPEPFNGSVPCPRSKCTCVDRYAFLDSMPELAKHPAEAFADRTRKLVPLQVL